MQVADDHGGEAVGFKVPRQGGGSARPCVEQNTDRSLPEQVAGTGLAVGGHARPAAENCEFHAFMLSGSDAVEQRPVNEGMIGSVDR